MQAYEEAFDGFGLKVAQILLTHDDLESRQRFLNARNTIFTLLQWRVVPIINENDTVATEELKLKFGDNDKPGRPDLQPGGRRPADYPHRHRRRLR